MITNQPFWKKAARRTASTLAIWAFMGTEAMAGGLTLYEVGTADVGLAAAGYAARAQDTSTVLTNPAGMTRLDGNRIREGLPRMSLDLDSTGVTQ